MASRGSRPGCVHRPLLSFGSPQPLADLTLASPSQEPKENANAQLVQHWKDVGRAQMKAARRRDKKERQEAKKAGKAARAAKTQRKKPSSSPASVRPASPLRPPCALR